MELISKNLPPLSTIQASHWVFCFLVAHSSLGSCLLNIQSQLQHHKPIKFTGDRAQPPIACYCQSSFINCRICFCFCSRKIISNNTWLRRNPCVFPSIFDQGCECGEKYKESLSDTKQSESSPRWGITETGVYLA